MWSVQGRSRGEVALRVILLELQHSRKPLSPPQAHYQEAKGCGRVAARTNVRGT